ncbi:MAG: hypothetical protein JST33_16345 [Actinobacteria bacterium]|nr:hypothetical protein [Actinomycetota bacterium]
MVAVLSLVVGVVFADPAIAVSVVSGATRPMTDPTAGDDVTDRATLPVGRAPSVDPQVPEGESGPAESLPAPVAEDVTTAPPAADAPDTNVPIDTSGLKVLARSETTTTFEGADGARVQQISSSPINVKNADGSWGRSTPLWKR